MELSLTNRIQIGILMLWHVFFFRATLNQMSNHSNRIFLFVSFVLLFALFASFSSWCLEASKAPCTFHELFFFHCQWMLCATHTFSTTATTTKKKIETDHLPRARLFNSHQDSRIDSVCLCVCAHSVNRKNV